MQRHAAGRHSNLRPRSSADCHIYSDGPHPAWQGQATLCLLSIWRADAWGRIR
jgi:hypothetical protein